MNWLLFFFALEAGLWSERTEIVLPPAYAVYEIQSPYVQLESGVEFFGFLELGGSATVLFADTSSWMYAPYDTRYEVFARARFQLAERLVLEAGGWHRCIHPNLSGERPDVGYLSGGGSRLYAALKARVGGK